MILFILLLVSVVVDIVFIAKQNFKAMFYTSFAVTVVLILVDVNYFLIGHPIMGAIGLALILYWGRRTFNLRQYR